MELDGAPQRLASAASIARRALRRVPERRGVAAQRRLERPEREIAQQLARERESDRGGLLVTEDEQRIGSELSQRLADRAVELLLLPRDREQELEIGMLEDAALQARGAAAAGVIEG